MSGLRDLGIGKLLSERDNAPLFVELLGSFARGARRVNEVMGPQADPNRRATDVERNNENTLFERKLGPFRKKNSPIVSVHKPSCTLIEQGLHSLTWVNAQ